MRAKSRTPFCLDEREHRADGRAAVACEAPGVVVEVTAEGRQHDLRRDDEQRHRADEDAAAEAAPPRDGQGDAPERDDECDILLEAARQCGAEHEGCGAAALQEQRTDREQQRDGRLGVELEDVRPLNERRREP